MKRDKLSNIIKNLFLSSLASIVTTNNLEASNVPPTDVPPESNDVHSLNLKKELSKKLVLKINKDSNWTVTSHRSHRSHSSHRSHYSSSSGSSSSGSSSSYNYNRETPTTSNSRNSVGHSNTSGTNSLTSAPTTNESSSSNQSSLWSPVKLTLGARNIKLGMTGSDITELINILIKKGYLELNNGATQVTGVYTYDETIEALIKTYQLNNNLPSDGVCGPTTIYHLKNK